MYINKNGKRRLSNTHTHTYTQREREREREGERERERERELGNPNSCDRQQEMRHSYLKLMDKFDLNSSMCQI